MSANVSALGAQGLVARAARHYPDGAAQWRLALVLALNLIALGLSFFLENAMLPWHVRMDSTTPGWCFVLAQAAVIGSVAALAIRSGWPAVIYAILAATLVGYAYVLAGVWLIDHRRPLQETHLIFRAVQLGMVSVAAMALGLTIRVVLRQRLLLTRGDGVDASRQYHLGELMFLVVVFAVGLGFVNLFFDHYDRETQLWDVALAALRAIPAALPWLWGVTQRRLSVWDLAMILLASATIMGIKIFATYALTSEESNMILERAWRRAFAYAAGGTFNGLVLRGLGFRWCRG